MIVVEQKKEQFLKPTLILFRLYSENNKRQTKEREDFMKKELLLLLFISVMLLVGCGGANDEGTESASVQETKTEIVTIQSDEDVEVVVEDTEFVESTEVSTEESTQVESEEVSEETGAKEETSKPTQEKPAGETQQPNQGTQSNNNQQSGQVEPVQPDNSQKDTSNDVVDTSNEVCPYPLYTLMYDNQGYPYYYGKWGGSANMDASNWAKTDACQQQMDDYMCENFTVWDEAHMNGSMSYDFSWQCIGNYQGMNVVVRYVEKCNGEFLSSPEARGIPTSGNGIWID